MIEMKKEIWEQPEVLSKCFEINRKTIEDIIKVINNKNIQSIFIAARGTSDHAAVYGKYILELITGIPVGLAAPSVFTMYGKTLKLKDSLVIGISQSGKAADVLEVLKSANLQGALTVSITNFADSPLAQEAQFHLYCNAGLEKSVAATKTFTAQILLLAQLAAEWSKNDEMKKELISLPEKVNKTLDISSNIQNLVPRYRFMDECFVLARGINYAVALESALKIQETTYVRAKAFASSDFYHGPFAMIDRDIPVIVFAPDGPSLKDSFEIVKKLKEHHIELLMISNQQEMLKIGAASISIPQTNNDIISPFFNVVAAQIFACELSLLKGLDPDSPRGLNKVTITR